MNNTPIFHPLTTKRHGDRVKLPKHPASMPNTTYWFGTVVGNRVEWDEPQDPPLGPEFRVDNPDNQGILLDA